MWFSNKFSHLSHFLFSKPFTVKPFWMQRPATKHTVPCSGARNEGPAINPKQLQKPSIFLNAQKT